MTMIAILRRAAIVGSVALATLGLSTAAFAQKTKLTVYTAIENEQLDPFKKAFEADNPAIEIAWVRDSTGVMTAKLIAEKDNPRADVIWGLAASSVGLRLTSTPPMKATPEIVIVGPSGVPPPGSECSKAPMMPTPVTRRLTSSTWACGNSYV